MSNKSIIIKMWNIVITIIIGKWEFGTITAFPMLKAHHQKYYDPRNVSSTISKQYLLRFSATKTTSRAFRFVDMWACKSIKAANDTQPLVLQTARKYIWFD